MTITVKLGSESYDIVIERGIIARAGQLLDLNRRVLVVTDDGVPRSYAEAVAAQCKLPVIFSLPGGEANKTLAWYGKMLSAMLGASFSRRDCVVAVGGGVVGDMSGFAASCYMRGIDFYNIPTTLLSQVDSSIGGKTAVNLDGIKNIVGTFCQPKRVLIDPDTLKTLSARQLRAGLAEAIKMAVTSDEALFALIEKSDDIYGDLEEIISRSLTIKRHFVEKDPNEQGIRRALNFGHTIGHAIEAFSDGGLLHGECVALGMLPMCGEDIRGRVKGVLEKYSLPTQIHQSAGELREYMVHDKKLQSGIIKAVRVERLGSYEICDMTPDDILDGLERLS